MTQSAALLSSRADIETASRIQLDPHGPVVLAGGRGVVGRRMIEILGAALPSRVTSRAPKADSIEAPILLDLDSPAPFSFRARAVVGLVNDPHDRLLMACARGGVPYVDITRYTPRLRAAQETLARTSLQAPVVLASGWMGGVVPLLARALADRLGPLDRVETSIVYDLADAAGPDSIEFLDRMHQPMEMFVDGAPRSIPQLGCAGTIDVAGRRAGMLHLDTPEQITLPKTLGARTVSTRIGFSSEAATCGLYVLGRLGFFHAFKSPRFTKLRRGLLYSNGPGGVARLRVDAHGERGSESIEVVDTKGQAHLTAVGARIALDMALKSSPGVYYPEDHTETQLALADLASYGVELTIRDLPRALVAA
jgi:hypothetical protein